MPSSQLHPRLPAGSAGAEISPSLVAVANRAADAESFLEPALQTIREFLGADFAGVFRGTKGRWRSLGEADPPQVPPPELLGEVLDGMQARTEQAWSAAPLGDRSQEGELLAIQSASPITLSQIDSVAAALSHVWRLVRKGQKAERRSQRLHAMLEITAAWGESRETDQLLEQMAATSTRLLNAERATIFLWDKPNQLLIGRPAMGVEGNELKISDTTGVVGNVVQTGEPARVDEDIAGEQAQIDRQVDELLDFQTRSLLCVPIFDRSEKIVGAFELINKRRGNFSDDDQLALTELAAHAGVAINNTQHVEKLAASLRNVADEAAQQVQLIGECNQLQKLKSTIARVAETDLAILILGENGTGKEVVAQLIHYLSNRRDNVLVAVNCAAITETLLESELFGHEKGAFTDAHQARQGKFELADAGTLFLDEIGDMSIGGQAKLLRVLEEKVVVRVGGSQPISTDARVVAATNQNLGELVQQKKFREDLFFRLNVVTLELPALRERGEDILLLAEHFLADFCGKSRRKVPKFSAAAKKALLGHPWPGNVRELRNMMERLAYLLEGDKVEAEDLAFILAPGKSEPTFLLDQSLTDATREFQRDFIQRHIDRARGNMTDAALRMGLHRSNLYRKMKQLGMNTDEESEETGDS